MDLRHQSITCTVAVFYIHSGSRPSSPTSGLAAVCGAHLGDIATDFPLKLTQTRCGPPLLQELLHTSGLCKSKHHNCEGESRD